MEQPARPSVPRDLPILRLLVAVGAAGFLSYALGRFVYLHFSLSDRLARLMTFL
jgi:hypothetical protein